MRFSIESSNVEDDTTDHFSLLTSHPNHDIAQKRLRRSSVLYSCPLRRAIFATSFDLPRLIARHPAVLACRLVEVRAHTFQDLTPLFHRRYQHDATRIRWDEIPRLPRIIHDTIILKNPESPSSPTPTLFQRRCGIMNSRDDLLPLTLHIERLGNLATPPS